MSEEKTIHQQMSESIQARLARFTGDGESGQRPLSQVLATMLDNIESWFQNLKDLNTETHVVVPKIVLAKYEGVLAALKNEGLPLKLRARDAERTTREILTSFAYYMPESFRADFEVGKSEALRAAKEARNILRGRLGNAL